MELDCIAKGLTSCNDCGQLIGLNRIIDKKINGFGSILYIECVCGVLNNVRTNKVHRAPGKSKGCLIYDINTKMATAKPS